MRKFVSVIIVGAMMLTLFLGFFGGVVEEVEGEITYDPGANTIYVNDTGQILLDILTSPDVPGGVFWFAAGAYHTNASIQINDSASLILIPGETLKLYNSSQLVYITVKGVLNAEGNSLNPITIESDNTTTAPGDWGGIKFLTWDASFSILDYVNIYNATIGLHTQSSDPAFSNCIIGGNSKNGLYIEGSSPIISNNEINNCGITASPSENGGIYLTSSSPIIENTTLNNTIRDIILNSDSNPVSINSYFDKNKVFIQDPASSLTVKWYLDIGAFDNETSDPIEGATVRIRDNENGTYDANFTTEADGYTRWIQTTQYVKTSATEIYYTPHNVNVSAGEYKSNSTYITINESKELQVNLSMLMRDLVIAESDISFSNGEPIAGEDVYITFFVHNYENDTAENVRVHLYNDTYLLEEYIISKIEGKGSKDRTKKWTAVPGIHEIRVEVDPLDEISEKNSTMPAMAELNNIASRTIIVNAPPEVNITDPTEGEEVKDTKYINGTANDSPDDVNDLTNVWVSLDDLDDWQEALINPIANPDGGHNWTYLWDTYQWNLTPVSDGPHTIKAMAFDGNHTSSTATVNVTVNNTGFNNPPVAIINEPPNPIFFSVNESIKFNGSLSYDLDGDSLTYEWDFKDGNFAYVNVTYHSFNQKGEYNVTLTVDDGQAQDVANVTVIIDNTPPYANVTASTESAYVNQTITFYGYNSTDEETPDALTFFWDYDDTVDANGDGNYTNDLDNLTTSPIENTTHFYNQSGNYNVTLTVWDGRINSSDSVMVTIQLLQPNEAPVAIINEPPNPSFFSVNETIKFNGSLSFDSDGDPLTYEWNFTDGNFSYVNVTYHSFSQKGEYNVTLTVNDSQAEGVTNVTIIIDNTPPYANVTSSTDTPYVNQTITFYGYNSTDEETPDTLTFLWDYDDTVDTNGDGNYTNDIDNLTTSPIENTTHSYNQTGTYNVTLTVWDGRINSIDTITVTVQPNAPPEAVIDSPSPLESFSVNETIVFNASSSSDLNDENLLYKWEFGNGEESDWLTNPITAYAYENKANPLTGYTFVVNLTVSDGNLEDIASVTIYVANYLPVAISKSNLTETLTNTSITFWGNESYDPDGLITNYTWDFGDGEVYTETSVFAPDGLFDGITTHQYVDNGTYMLNLTVTDNAPTTNPASNSTNIYIIIINRDPKITNATASSESPATGEEVYFNVTASDDDGKIVKYSWAFGDGETYYEDENYYPDGVFDGKTTHSYSAKDTYTVIISVEDDDGGTNTTELTITVKNTLPKVNITSPTEDESVSDTITVEGNAWDVDGYISKVEVKIDGGNWLPAIDTSGDWSTWIYSWDTRDVNNGTHKIYARANDSESWSDPSPNVTVYVDNPPTDITVTANLNQSTVESGGLVEVYGYVTYDTGGPAEDAEINVTIQNEVGYWLTSTDNSGYYTSDITAPSSANTYVVRVDAKKGSFNDVDQKNLQVIEITEPDLTVSTNDISFNPSAPDSGDTVDVIITVHNNGDGDANNVGVNVYRGDSDSRDTLIGSDTLTIIAAGGNQQAMVDWDTSGISGEVYIYVVLDPDGIITESDETNNEASRPITVQGKPDFAITGGDITFGTLNPKQGETFTILITISNLGSEDGTVNYKAYDGDPDAGGMEIYSGSVFIAADDDETESIEWTPDEGGEHEIWIRLDPNSIIDEFREDNNDAHKTVTVEALPPEEGIPGWLIPLIVILVVVVLLLLFILNRRGMGPKPEQELPVAKVVDKEAEATEEEEKKESLMESQGGIRIG